MLCPGKKRAGVDDPITDLLIVPEGEDFFGTARRRALARASYEGSREHPKE